MRAHAFLLNPLVGLLRLRINQITFGVPVQEVLPPGEDVIRQGNDSYFVLDFGQSLHISSFLLPVNILKLAYYEAREFLQDKFVEISAMDIIKCQSQFIILCFPRVEDKAEC